MIIQLDNHFTARRIRLQARHFILNEAIFAGSYQDWVDFFSGRGLDEPALRKYCVYRKKETYLTF